MSRFLLDANLSLETAAFLRESLQLDAVSLTPEQLTLKDPQIVALARSQGRVIITFDLDFGELYHFREQGQLGVIILRLEDQTVESVNAVLATFFASNLTDVDLDRSLVVIDERRVRIVRGGEAYPHSSFTFATSVGAVVSHRSGVAGHA